MKKISYRVCFNHNHKTNKRGEGLIEIEARQDNTRCYFSTHTYVMPEQFKDGYVTNHKNAEYLNMVLADMKHTIEKIELESIITNRTYPTVSQLKAMYKSKAIPSALLCEFGKVVIRESDRKKSTQAGYNIYQLVLMKYNEITMHFFICNCR